ncbi:cyclic nucleotide-binding protein [Sphingobacteriaceae bacterium]|nr:cyclic nucleotide-binding protein [Sphingobacteriaceae bacterium]
MKATPLPSSAAPLVDYFNRIMPLTTEETELVSNKFHSRLYRKKQFLLQEGDLCNTISFVVKGCLRMYKVDDSGTTHIIQFAIENWWVSDLGSFYKRYPSALNIEAIEETVVLQISHDDLLNLYEIAPKFNQIFRVLMENNLVGLQERLLQNISTDARVRYESFLKQYPTIVNRVPNTYIASFLGITPEFLSRIRNERVSQKHP